MTEQLNSVEQRKIINNLLEQVMQNHPDVYYAPTTDVARMIHTRLQETLSRMSIEDQLLMKKVTTRDIEIMLSLN